VPSYAAALTAPHPRALFPNDATASKRAQGDCAESTDKQEQPPAALVRERQRIAAGTWMLLALVHAGNGSCASTPSAGDGDLTRASAETGLLRPA
jgi:hypothetical protein